MRVISRKTLKTFWERELAAEAQLKAWFCEVKDADWKTPADVKAKYRSASILKNNRAVLNICGNKYRVVVSINYQFRVVYVRFVGTHAEYDQVDAEKI